MMLFFCEALNSSELKRPKSFILSFSFIINIATHSIL